MSAIHRNFDQGWVRWGLLLGLALAAVGYLGPWVAHPTAALTLTGPDLGEFVKFLPQGAPSGRQLFYAPAVAVVVVAALVARRYPWSLRAPLVLLAVPVSAQVLPPAWSVPVLLTSEFRAQTVALVGCWLLLLAHGWLGRLPPRWVGAGAAVTSLAAGASAAWQYLRVRPAIGAVYSASGALQPVGWGWFVCLGGLALIAGSGLVLSLRGEAVAP
jgi:hypothetical protein